MEITKSNEPTVQGFNRLITFLFSLTLSSFGAYYIFKVILPSIPPSVLGGSFFVYIPFGFLLCLIIFFVTFFIIKKALLKYNQKLIVSSMVILIILGMFMYMNFSANI